MRVGLRWLNELVPVDVPVERLVDLLDMSGTKVESVDRPSRGIGGVVVAKVLQIEPHPNADNLSLVEVEVARRTTERVVCGASNFAVGDRVPLATVGARLPDMEITERKIRGTTSRGMLCSAAELGVSKDHSGILVLPQDAPLGDDVTNVLGLDDTVIELEITPNRPDCMSMIGVAREVGALLNNPMTVPEVEIAYSDVPSPVDVTIEDPEGCPRYLAMYLDQISVGPSPSWLVARLTAAGVRSISNIVDVTNYVLLETGQPLHAFDGGKVTNQRIIVRRARRSERLKTLDGDDRELHPDDLLITDPARGIALAGIMGGEDTEVSDGTGAVILECAYFDPSTVAYTSRRHLLRTEASARFERGADPEIIPYAAARAAALMAQLSGGRVSENVIDRYPVEIERRKLSLRPSRTDQILGYPLSSSEQTTHLTSIGLTVAEREGWLEVEVPTFRPDITREIDLVEEVGRLAGFDRLPSTVPAGLAGYLEPIQKAERSVRRLLSAQGLSEAWTSSFFSERDLDRLGLPGGHAVRSLVTLENPMSQDENAMRTTLLPGVLRSVSRNFAQRRSSGVALFEIARVYEPSSAQLPQEGLLLTAIMSGERTTQGWRAKARPWDFFAAKGILQSTIASLQIHDVAFSSREAMPFHPTRAADITVGGRTAGVLGQLHPDVCERFEVPEGTVAFEIALAPVFAAMPARVAVDELPRFPAILIDLAVVVDDGIDAASVERLIRDAGGPEVASVRLFDLYRGSQVPDGKKSLAFALELRDPVRTLKDEDAVRVRDRIMDALGRQIGAALRA
jgi:phenylalanyl-tRNA synthetase beta chain